MTNDEPAERIHHSSFISIKKNRRPFGRRSFYISTFLSSEVHANDGRHAPIAHEPRTSPRENVVGVRLEKLGEAEARISSIKANAMKEVGSIAEDTASAIVEALVGGGKASKTEIAAAVKSVAR